MDARPDSLLVERRDEAEAPPARLRGRGADVSGARGAQRADEQAARADGDAHEPQADPGELVPVLLPPVDDPLPPWRPLEAGATAAAARQDA